MKHILKNRLKEKKWLQYFLASLLISALFLTGCSAVQKNDDGNTGGTAVNQAAESETDTPTDEETAEPAEDGTYSS